MANPSIYAAFERLWQQVVALVGGKANVIHSHDDLYYTEAEVDEIVSGKINRSGDTMTGALTLAADPTENLQAATKQYVDNNSGGKNVWYGTCATAAATAAKTVTTDSNFQLDTGVILFVTFTNAHSTSSMTLSVNGGTAVTVYKNGTTKIDSGMVAANETICFIYDGTYFRMENGSAASTSQYGLVKLSSSTSSTSTSLAATPSAVKKAYDLADGANTTAETANATATEAKTAVEELANEVVYINEEDNENIEDPQESTDAKIAEHNADITAHSDIRDLISTVQATASEAKTTADAALPKTGGVMTGDLTAATNNTGTTAMVRNIAYGSSSGLASLANTSNNGTILIYTS